MGVGDGGNKCQVRINIFVGSNLGGSFFDLRTSQVVEEVGNRLGRVLEVKKQRNNESQNFFMQVKVAIPL